MKSLLVKASTLMLVLMTSATAVAGNDFGVGVKAGTLGAGIEGTWKPLPYMDFRLGLNLYDYDESGALSGINYDATLSLETLYATANFHFPLSPFRVTGGLYSNGNELNLVSKDSLIYDVGGQTYTSADVGQLTSKASFASTAPYVGVGYDFSLFGKVGLNLDFGLLWQGEADVTLTSDGLLANDPQFQAALETERQELEDDASNFKAWPVVTLGFAFRF